MPRADDTAVSGGMSGIAQIASLEVFLEDKPVGTLARDEDGLACFEYDPLWLSEGFSISPLSLPLKAGLFRPKWGPFDGMFGVFSDSLPDGWGRLLVDRTLRARGIAPESVDELSRLALVGLNGMGALRYVPALGSGDVKAIGDFDAFAASCRALLVAHDADDVDDLDKLFVLGGSSGGARPKALITAEDGEWIVKFPAFQDGPDAGKLEYKYAECARACGLRVPETKLFPSKQTPGYFGVRRFDREEGRRIHMVSAAGLLEASHRVPSLDYRMLMQLTLVLTDSMAELEQMYRLMCFNVFAHNQDDHAKNFSFLCRDGCWELSPAYDLTFCTAFGGEHATTVKGKGRPARDDVLDVAREFGLPSRRAAVIADEVQSACGELLAQNGLRES